MSKTLLVSYTWSTRTKEGSGYHHFSWIEEPAGTPVQACLDNIRDTILRPLIESNIGFINCQDLKVIFTSVQDITGVLVHETAAATPYLLGGEAFHISINGEGGYYGFEDHPELDGKWVALVDATDDLHMDRIPVMAPGPQGVLAQILRQKCVLKAQYNVEDDQLEVMLGQDSLNALKEEVQPMAHIPGRSVVEDKVEGMRIIRLSNPADLILVAIRP